MPADPPVTERVHVVPLGFEYARLRQPVVDWKADAVVAVEHAGSDATIPYLDEFLAELDADERVDLVVRSCDIFDLYDALGTIAAAIDDYPDDEVFVNLSAGSKITAIAGMIACMATGARPIYARPDYGPDAEHVPEEPLHSDVDEVFELPTYPIDRPSETLVTCLSHIDEADGEAGTGATAG
ncbi:DUF6293 family protein [Halospeciosus flavus]|uniref:HFX_2341 family transcriptional regulator domain-containing protein n=1 Tax=Halospeciosus flavus TaxID=3032283 RepID=UPI0036129F10